MRVTADKGQGLSYRELRTGLVTAGDHPSSRLMRKNLRFYGETEYRDSVIGESICFESGGNLSIYKFSLICRREQNSQLFHLLILSKSCIKLI